MSISLTRVIHIRMEAQEILKSNGKNYELIAKLIEPLAKEEKHVMGLFKDGVQQKMYEESFKLDSDIEKLRSELYRFEMRREIRKVN